VELALEASRPALEAGRHRLELALAPQPLGVLADLTRMAQVLSNLLNNAAKYTPDGGHVHLSLQREGDEAVLRVTDDGLGLPPEMLTQIFEMFTQVDSTLNRAQGGLGIGLSLARNIVELHGGSIHAHSEGLGRGTTFTCRLPLLPEGTGA
jgi:signal transduction histidine kinase